MNKNITNLNLIKTLFMDLIYNDLKYHLALQIHISGLVNQIKSNINFLLTEYYFTNIIEFEKIKKKLMYLLYAVLNIFSVHGVNVSHNVKIKHILNIIKLIIYPSYLNLNNTSKYKNEINVMKKINFFHKYGTFDIKNTFYDGEIDLDEINLDEINILQDKTLMSTIIDNEQLQNNKNFIISNKLKGNRFYNKIDFSKSNISI